MLIVIGLMVSGILLGYIFRQKNLKIVQHLITYAIFALLFLLGISVGTNRDIMDNLGTIGVDALVITIGAVGGSVLCAWGIYKYYFSK